MTPIKSSEPVALDEVLGYRHPGVLVCYCKDHNVSREEAEEVFREMLKWLYLCYRSTNAGPEGVCCAVFPEITKIDWMWHAFILFTRDYADFCDRYFGFFLHHVPAEAETEVPVDEEASQAELEKQYPLVYDVLGEETPVAWYEQCRYAATA
jgi:hypothetical protein